MVVYNNTTIKKISIYGYTKDNNSDKVRSLGSEITSYLNSNKVKNVAIDVKSFSITNKNLQAFVEGLVLGSYEFLNYKPKAKSSLLNSITLIGNIDENIAN